MSLGIKEIVPVSEGGESFLGQLKAIMAENGFSLLFRMTNGPGGPSRGPCDQEGLYLDPGESHGGLNGLRAAGSRVVLREHHVKGPRVASSAHCWGQGRGDVFPEIFEGRNPRSHPVCASD